MQGLVTVYNQQPDCQLSLFLSLLWSKSTKVLTVDVPAEGSEKCKQFFVVEHTQSVS